MHEIKEIIENLSGVKILTKYRGRKNVEMRSLFCYVSRKYLKKTLYSIADYIARNGENKTYNHSSVIHSINNYEMYKMYNTDIAKYEEYIRAKLLYPMTIDRAIAQLKGLNDEDVSEVIKLIEKYTNGLQHRRNETTSSRSYQEA